MTPAKNLHRLNHKHWQKIKWKIYGFNNNPTFSLTLCFIYSQQVHISSVYDFVQFSPWQHICPFLTAEKTHEIKRWLFDKSGVFDIQTQFLPWLWLSTVSRQWHIWQRHWKNKNIDKNSFISLFFDFNRAMLSFLIYKHNNCKTKIWRLVRTLFNI